MTGPEMLRLILRDFGLVSREELRRGVLAAADVPQLLDALEGFLRSLISIDSRAVVVIDEAQSLSPTLLDEVRMLTAFERDGQRLIQIVLCGQPMLLNTLKTEPMYALERAHHAPRRADAALARGSRAVHPPSAGGGRRRRRRASSSRRRCG